MLKISSTRLKRANWNLNLPLAVARKNDEVIALSDSQVMRWIDELNGDTDADERAREIRRLIKEYKRQQDSLRNRREIKRLYVELDKIQFKKDYLCLVIDKNKDYYKACKGFTINGVRYERLVGTSGGIKNKTIVFISSKLAPEIKRRIDNGRKPDTLLVPAKFEAYRALVCSGSTPVSFPNKIAVVPECETRFWAGVINIDDAGEGEPVMTEEDSAEVVLDESDGYGLISPELCRRWSEELRLRYTTSGFNTRCAFEKGMVFCFDFHDFADKVAGKYIIKDAWGDEVDIREVDLVLTTSMVKLWSSYDSCEHYMRESIKNGYTFAVTKVCPERLESERNLNYQFIQSYDLDNDRIHELIDPTIKEIHDALLFDYRKSILFLKGGYLTDKNIDYISNDYIKALMLEPRLINDPFVRKKIYYAIKNRITEAKVGVVMTHGNYSVVCGDPYSLCQSVFGCEVTGLLKAGEIYNRYWAEYGAEKLACFRAPMTSKTNIRPVRVARGEDVEYWYQYLTTCTLFNSWDTAAHALNGMDKDGDLVFLTDNKILVENLSELPAIMCAQRQAEKKIPTEEDIIASNIAGFGDDIGKTTNWITSMFSVKARFPEDSEESRMLEYRIKCGQNYQQNAIDKIKGIVVKPMPKEWYDRRACRQIRDYRKRRLYSRIVADKKPYFMRYIYPALMKQYVSYCNSSNRKCIREFGVPILDLLRTRPKELTEEQRQFLRYYFMKMPVDLGDCAVNRICKEFEIEFDDYWKKYPAVKFDWSILKSNAKYTGSQYEAVLRLYTEYQHALQEKAGEAASERINKDYKACREKMLRERFARAALEECSNAQSLCNMLLDICYRQEGTKQLVWDICSDQIIDTLLTRSNQISYPVADPEGDFEYGGKRYTMHTKKLEAIEI